MNKFCSKCGTPTVGEEGLCPVCDRDKLENSTEQSGPVNFMKFCDQCGSEIDQETGACTNPYCSKNSAQKSEAAIQVIQAEPSPKKKKSKSVTTVITVLLSICLFFTSLFAVVIFDVRNFAQEDNVEEIVENLDGSDILDAIKDFSSNSDLVLFYDELYNEYRIEMDDKGLADFIDDSDIKDFFVDKIADFSEDLFDDEAELVIEKDEIMEVLDENSEYFREEFGTRLTYEIRKDIVDWFLEDDKTVVVNIKDDVPAVYYVLTIGFSYVTLAVFILLSALIIFLMFNGSFSHGACGVGITFIVFGGLFSLLAMLAGLIPSLWNAIFDDSYIGLVAGKFITINSLPGIIMLVLGIGLLVARVIVKKYVAKKQSAQNL